MSKIIIVSLFILSMSCNEQGGARQKSKQSLNEVQQIQQNNGLDQQGSPSPNVVEAAPSPFETGERSTMQQCDNQGKVWIAVSPGSGNIPICGQPSVNWGCCIEEIAARFPTKSAQITEFNKKETSQGYELYTCENVGNGEYRFHYAKPGSTRNGVDYRFMNFKSEIVTPEIPSNCPVKPKLSDKLTAQLMRYQTPESFVESDDPMQGEGSVDENITYPIYNMASKGNMTHRKGSVTLVANIDFQTKKDSFYLNQTGTRAISGAYVKDVNKNLGGSNGKKTGIRSTASELADEEENNYKFINTNFLIFSSELKNIKGEVFNLESPLPSIVSPGAKSRYDVFYGFPELKYTTAVTGKINTTVDTVITREVNTSDRVVIKIVHNINDPSGQLYQSFPLPHAMQYTIDPIKKIILSIESTTFYHDPKGGGSKRYQTVSTSKTCKILSGSVEKTYPCQ